MQMTAFQKVIFCLLFLPGYILVFLGSFTRTKGDIRKAQKQYKEIHFYGPFYSMLIYILILGIFWLMVLNEQQLIQNTQAPQAEITEMAKDENLESTE
tara:strand:- start:582 stop:875 length:294 start_codon:yes stop_codon:yes gene_type:complete